MNVLVVGLGYVGLPLLIECSSAGHLVTGLDNSEKKVALLASGVSHVDDVSDRDVSESLSRGAKFLTELGTNCDFDVAVICVPTPLSTGSQPDLSFIESAAKVIASRLRRGNLVVLESTTYPGTTEEIVIPILENHSGLTAGVDFKVAYSPERIDPGNRTFTLKNTPKVVGGLDSSSARIAEEFYSTFVDQVVVAKGLREAETAKLLENTYRHINIALVNEMAIFCHDLNIDIWDVVRCASSKPFGFAAFTPGPGVGGHCIPIDPNYLSYKVKLDLGYPFKFVEMAQSINTSMPGYVAQRIRLLLNAQKLPVNGAKILLVGVTYKKNSRDIRESPASDLARILINEGAEVSFFDPLAPEFFVDSLKLPSKIDLSEAAGEADAVVVLQAHDSVEIYRLTPFISKLFDASNCLGGDFPGVARL